MRYLPHALAALLFFALGVAFGIPYGAYLQEGSDWKASDYANFWNIGGTWFSAVATTLVAALALYFQHIAEEGRKPKLQTEFYFLPKKPEYGHEGHIEVKLKSNCVRKILISEVSFIINNKPVGLEFCRYSKKTPVLIEDFESELSFYYKTFEACSFIASQNWEIPVEISIKSSIGNINFDIPAEISRKLEEITEEIGRKK